MEQNYSKEKDLLERFKEGKTTAEENLQIAQAFNEFAKQAEQQFEEQDMAKIGNQIWMRLPVQQLPSVTKRLWFRIAATAAVFVLIFSGLYFYIEYKGLDKERNVVLENDVKPGRTGATLTLGNGQKIKLADQQNGKLAQTGGVQISKLANGQLLYEIKDQSNPENQMNTLSTARGEVYQLRLPDGSRVWINSASSITYPTMLNNQQAGGQRIVRLSGEAYFEIAKDKKHPFIVMTSGQQVQVLGTHFNISAYLSDKFTRTTLLEGAVKVSSSSGSSLLRPNQQAELSGSALKVTDINAAYEVGWKDGVFVFNYEPLEAVMTKISRWYDLNVVYVDPSVKDELFFGTVSKFEQLSKALNMLARTEVVRFEVDGKTVRVFKR